MDKPRNWIITLMFGIGASLLIASVLKMWPEKKIVFHSMFFLGLLLFVCPAILWVSNIRNVKRRMKLSLPLLCMIVFGLSFIVSTAFYFNQKANPIKWDFSGFIGGMKREGVQAHAAVFQVNGINRSNKFIKFSDIHIISLITGKSIPVTIKTNISGDNPYVNPSEHAPIPNGVKIYAHALFYDKNNRYSEHGLEGLPQDMFMKKFGKFNFVVKYSDGKIYTHKFDTNEIEAQFDKHLYWSRNIEQLVPLPQKKHTEYGSISVPPNTSIHVSFKETYNEAPTINIFDVAANEYKVSNLSTSGFELHNISFSDQIDVQWKATE